MTTPLGTDAVVVGVDGSAAGLAAAKWAVAEAGRRNAALRVVRVQEPIPAGMSCSAMSSCVTAGDLGWAVQSVQEAVGQVKAGAPLVPVTGEVIFGNIVDGLLAAGAQSQLLVLGCHSTLPRSLRRYWSYVAAVTSRSDVPVTVVEPVAAANAASPAVSDPVVVLTDTVAAVERLAEYGCAEAEMRRTDVEIVMVSRSARRGRRGRFADELDLFEALTCCRDRWSPVKMTGLVAFAGATEEVGNRLSRASLLVMDARRGRRLLRRSGLSRPLGMRAGPPALTVLPAGFKNFH